MASPCIRVRSASTSGVSVETTPPFLAVDFAPFAEAFAGLAADGVGPTSDFSARYSSTSSYVKRRQLLIALLNTSVATRAPSSVNSIIAVRAYRTLFGWRLARLLEMISG